MFIDLKKIITLKNFSILIFSSFLILCLITIRRYYYDEISYSLFLRIISISLAITLLGFYLFLTNVERRRSIFLVIFSTIISIYIIEIGLRYIYFDHDDKDSIQSSNHESKGFNDYLRFLQEKNSDYVPFIAPLTFFDQKGIIGKSTFAPIQPLSGISNSPTLLCNESGYYATYESDRYGFNNNDDIWDSHKDKWVTVGDSFAHGACVFREDTIASKLMQNINQEVVNLGYSGNGPIATLASIVEYAEKLKPKKVFWLFCEGNDLTDLLVEEKSQIIRKYLDKEFTQNLINKQDIIDYNLYSYLDFTEKLISDKRATKVLKKYDYGLDHFTRIVRLYNIRELLNINFYSESYPSILKKILSTAKSRVESWGGELYFVFLPKYLRYSKIINNNEEYNFKNLVKKDVLDLGVKFIDIDKRFSESEDPKAFFPFKINGHYTPEGYELVATTIKNNI